MKKTILIILAIELLLLFGGLLKLFVVGFKSDLAGQGMTIAYTVIATVVVVVLMIASYALAANDRWLWFALVLALTSGGRVLVVLAME